jgi:hypothetical protein
VDKRPVNLHISIFSLPITAIASITHRVAGIVLLAGVLILLWMLGLSLESEESFNELKSCMDAVWVKNSAITKSRDSAAASSALWSTAAVVLLRGFAAYLALVATALL